MLRHHLRPLTVAVMPMLAVLAATILTSPSSLPAQVDKKKSGGQVVFSVAPQSSSSFDVSAAFACPGEAACRPAVVRVVLMSIGKPKYADDHSVDLILDQETELSVANPSYRAQKGTGRQAYEIITCMMPTADFLALSAAEKVGLRVGTQEAELTKKQLKKLAALAAAIPEVEEDL
jgi:hypothetical protein